MTSAKVDLKKAWAPGLLLVILALLATLTLYASTYTVILVTSILMYVVLTMSWVIFAAPTGYVSLATAAFFGVGVYTAALLGRALPVPLFVLVGGVACFFTALLVGSLTLRLRGIYFAIFTLGLVQLIKNLLVWYEVSITKTRGRLVILVGDNTIYHVMLVIFAILLLTAYLIRRSKYGLALRSIGQSEDAAAHAGVNVNLLKTLTFALSAAFMGAAGAIMATKWTYIDPYVAFNLLYSFMPVLMAIFGGMGPFLGPVLGAAIFGYLEEILITRFPYYYMLVFGVILIITIIYLPAGLAGLVQKLWMRTLGGKRALVGG